MIVGSFGDYVFEAAEGKTFNALRWQRAARLSSHATLEGLPLVEMLGLDSPQITLSGTFSRQYIPDLDDAIMELCALQDDTPRALTRGTRCYGLFIVQSVQFSEDRWCGDVPEVITWTMQLISTRGQNG